MYKKYFLISIITILAVPLLVSLLGSEVGLAGSCSSAQTGPWATPSTWGAGCTGGGGIPAAGDTVTILNTHVVTVASGISAAADSIIINTGGTLDGVGNVLVSGGNVTGDGTISMTGGTFLVDATGNFGGATSWTFNNLTFGNGSGSATTTATGTGAITVNGSLAVAIAQILDAGSKTWNLNSNTVAATSAAHRSHAISAYGARTNTVQTAPAGIADGDALVLIFQIGAVGTPPTPTPPAGFAIANNYPVSTTDPDGFRIVTYVWYKIASAESGNYTITHAVASTDAYMVAVSGADISSPLNPDPTSDSGAGAPNASSVATAPGLTTINNNSLVMFYSVNWNATGGDRVAPGGSTPTFTVQANDASMVTYVADGVLAAAGATGDKTQTVNNGGDPDGLPWRAGLIAVNSSPVMQPFSVAGTFTPSSSTVVFAGNGASTVPAATFNNLTFGGSGTYTMPSSTINLLGNLNIANGATVTKGAGTIVFKKGATQTWTDGNAAAQDLGNVQVSVNSTNTTLTQASNIKFTSLTIDASQTFSEGASFNLATTGAGTVITNNGTWSNLGTGDIVLSGNVSNAGTITLNSNNGAQCVDGADSIAITSSSGGTQRNWSGAGTFNLYNIDARDMTDASITAYTSTFTNTTWTAGNCVIPPPPIPPSPPPSSGGSSRVVGSHPVPPPSSPEPVNTFPTPPNPPIYPPVPTPTPVKTPPSLAPNPVPNEPSIEPSIEQPMPPITDPEVIENPSAPSEEGGAPENTSWLKSILGWKIVTIIIFGAAFLIYYMVGRK